jgi:hypothetical protein
MGWGRLLMVILALGIVGNSCWGQEGIEATELQLVNCSPATTVPCFRLQFRVLGADLSYADQLARLTVTADGYPVRIFSTRSLGSMGGEATFPSPYPDLASLNGRTIDFDFALPASDGQAIKPERLVRWRSGDLSANFDDICTQDERAKSNPRLDLTTVWRPIVVFLLFALVLAATVFLVPRFMWPPAPPANFGPVRRSAG